MNVKQLRRHQRQTATEKQSYRKQQYAGLANLAPTLRPWAMYAEQHVWAHHLRVELDNDRVACTLQQQHQPRADVHYSGGSASLSFRRAVKVFWP